MKICSNIRISERDYLPHSICYECLNQLRTAYEFKKKCEETDKELRQKLKRSKNKARKPSDFILIDANLYDEESYDEEINDDDDFKVSDEEEEVVDSDDSYEEESKRKSVKKRPPKKSSSRSSKGRSKGGPSPMPKGRSRAKPAPAPTPVASNKKKSTTPASKKTIPDLSSTAKRLKRDIVYIEANYDSSDDDTPIKKRKAAAAQGNSEGEFYCLKNCLENGDFRREKIASSKIGFNN
jgi:hypothetical protein